MGTGAAIVLALGLAVIPYNFGSGRWRSTFMENTYGIGLMMFMAFMPWFVVAIALGANRALIPVVMILFAAAFAAGWIRRRGVRSRQ